MYPNNPQQPSRRSQMPPAVPPNFQPPTMPISAHRPPQPNPYQITYRPPARKRRVFLWVFLGIQVLFLLWLVVGLVNTSHTGAEAHAQAVQFCSDPSNWHYLYKSQAACVTNYGNTLNGASDAGKTIGAAFIVVVWCVVDFFMMTGYLIYKLSSRH